MTNRSDQLIRLLDKESRENLIRALSLCDKHQDPDERALSAMRGQMDQVTITQENDAETYRTNIVCDNCHHNVIFNIEKGGHPSRQSPRTTQILPSLWL